MKRILLLAVLISAPAFGQTREELQQAIRDREAEITRLRTRLADLENRVGPEVLAPEDVDLTRALERSLVREGASVIPPGSYEVEPNFVYSHVSTDINDFRRDSYGPALAFRVGLPWASQFDFSVPYVFEDRHTAVGSRSANGVGDVALSLSHQLLDEGRYKPALVGSVGYSFATGSASLFTPGVPVSLGAGFDTISGGLTASKRMDPLVFFGGYNFSHGFDTTENGIAIEPGNTHSLRLGVALAASPDTSLRTAFTVSRPDTFRVNGVGVPNTNQTTGFFEVGGSMVVTSRLLLDVLAGAGVTGNTPDFRLAVALPFRF